MSYEINVAIQIADNTQQGALLQVGATQTLPPVAWPGHRKEEDNVRELYLGVFSQMELLTDAMVSAIRDQIQDQLHQHKARLAEGTHTLLQR